MIDFTSRQLRAFLLVARHRSFSRAAEALFITPSGLSVLIRELETQLGFRLFERTTRHVALTSHGSELLVVAQQNLEQFDTAVSRIGQSAKPANRYRLARHRWSPQTSCRKQSGNSAGIGQTFESNCSRVTLRRSWSAFRLANSISASGRFSGLPLA